MKTNKWYMPDEGIGHAATWMSFVASNEIWRLDQITEVLNNLATIATTIAKYEPVKILARRDDKTLVSDMLTGLDSHNFPISLFDAKLDDLWVRDTGPTFLVNDDGEKSALDLNFNGWGGDQTHQYDSQVAQMIANLSDVKHIVTELVLEGGCFEVDGDGTAIMTESCIINENRNPDLSKKEIEEMLKTLLGLDKVIWLKGIKGRDITDGHTDFYARFAKPGCVVVSKDNDKSSYDYEVTRENIRLLKQATDANGKSLELVTLDTPWEIETRYGVEDFAAGYVGYYVCNNAVIMQKFGDRKADKEAYEKIAALFPDRVIESIRIDGIASGGGSIHCATQQEPAV